MEVILLFVTSLCSAAAAAALGAKLPEGAGEDRVSLLPLLKGSTAPVREFAISHARSGLPALRRVAPHPKDVPEKWRRFLKADAAETMTLPRKRLAK